MQTVITNATYKKTISVLEKEYVNLSDDGCFFALVRTEYDIHGSVIHDFLDIISYAIEIGYEYVNTIVYPSSIKQNCAFCDNVKYIVWLAKNHAKMKFNKDLIRERHIWKDVEWGKREKNYNPKGKDPGNVWIPTEDDGKANITKHILLDDSGVISRIISMTECGKDYKLIQEKQVIHAITHNKTVAQKIKKNTCCGKVYFKSSEHMNDLQDNSVKLVVTSPPYWNLKDYFKNGQIGQESYEKYLERMYQVWSECYNKLSPTGSLWININIRIQNGKIIPIPSDFVKMCKKLGFFYKGIVIWHKSSGIPTGEKNIVDRHEYVLIFSKKEDYFVDDSVFSKYSDYKNEVLNGGAFWNINRKAGSVGKKYIHPAIYPNELVSRIINVSTIENDLVLDPFLGSGTSIISAMQNQRNSIGYEYNEGFEELIHSRFDNEIPGAIVDFITDK